MLASDDALDAINALRLPRYALFDYTIQADAPDHNGEE